MAEITVSEFIQKLQEFERIRDVNITERLLITAGNAMLASLKGRIFDDGLATNMQKISDHYRWQKKKYTREDFQGVKGSRFNANTTIKDRQTGKEEPAMFIPDAYEGFRRLAGRQTNYVDLELTGSLKNSIQLGKSGSNVVIGITSKFQSDKRKEIENGIYKKDIFKPSEPDKQEFRSAILKEIKFLLTKSR